MTAVVRRLPTAALPVIREPAPFDSFEPYEPVTLPHTQVGGDGTYARQVSRSGFLVRDAGGVWRLR